MSNTISDAGKNRIAEILRHDRFIEAVKLHRELTGSDLLAAKRVSSGYRPGSRHAKESPDDVNEENMVLSGLPANCSNGSGRAIGGRRHTKEAKPAA